MAQQTESSASRPGPRPEVVYYYDGPGILVTSQYIDTAPGCFPVAELDPIYCEYEETRFARKVALGCGGCELLLSVPLAVAYGAVPLVCAGFVAAVGLGIAVAVERRNNPTWMRLVAQHRGRVVPLYCTADRLEFGRVHRAVLRAVEANEQPERLLGTDLMVARGPYGRSATSRARPGHYDRR